MEQLDYNLMYRWFVRLGIDDPVWDATVFTKVNRLGIFTPDRRAIETPLVDGVTRVEGWSCGA